MVSTKTIMGKDWSHDEVAQQAAEELRDSDYVNLSTGIPTLVTDHIPGGVRVLLQSENGILGMGIFPYEGEENADLINADRQIVTLVPGAAIFNSATSSGVIRDDAVKMVVLGAMEVGQCDDLVNWMILRKMAKGMGGVMDLVVGTPRMVALTDHVSKDGRPRLVKARELPLTGVKVVKRIIGNLGSFDVVDDHLVLRRLAPGVTLADIEVDARVAYVADLEN